MTTCALTKPAPQPVLEPVEALARVQVWVRQRWAELREQRRVVDALTLAIIDSRCTCRTHLRMIEASLAELMDSLDDCRNPIRLREAKSNIDQAALVLQALLALPDMPAPDSQFRWLFRQMLLRRQTERVLDLLHDASEDLELALDPELRKSVVSVLGPSFALETPPCPVSR
jgi:hypothetical protein